MIGHGGEGLLLDQGSPDNLQGSGWARRVASAAVAAGRPPPRERKHVMDVGGVGQGAVRTQKALCHTIALETLNGPADEATFDAPVVESETIPGLLGLKAQHRMKAWVDTENYRMIVPGPGGVKMQLSPGSVVYQGYPTVSGHMMIPCTEFEKSKGSSTPTVLLTGASGEVPQQVAAASATHGRDRHVAGSPAAPSAVKQRIAEIEKKTAVPTTTTGVK